MFLSFEGWGACCQIFGTGISIDWILRTVFSQLSRKLHRAEDSLHVQASSPLSWTYRMPSARLHDRATRAPRVGTNSLKIYKPAPILLKESATPKSVQTQGPIYLKKLSQNRYIGTWVWQKIEIHILVPRFAHFKVARP